MKKIKQIFISYYNDSVRNQIINKIYNKINFCFNWDNSQDEEHYWSRTSNIYIKRDSPPKIIWHEIGHMVWDKFVPMKNKKIFISSLMIDIYDITHCDYKISKDLSPFDFYISDGIKIATGKTVEGAVYFHDDDYYRGNIKVAADETFAHIFAAFMLKRKFLKANYSKKAFKEVINLLLK